MKDSDSNKISLAKLRTHAKRCIKKGVRFNWLGFLEGKDLERNVEDLFRFSTPTGFVGYDWVHGNDCLKQFVEAL